MQKRPTVDTENAGNSGDAVRASLGAHGSVSLGTGSLGTGSLGTGSLGAGASGVMPRAVRAPLGFSVGNETPLPPPEPLRDELGPLVGRTFGGYEIVSYIGEGPSGAVYRGEDLLGNAMAVKVLHAGLTNRDRHEQLRIELNRLSALDHPQLQKIYDAGYGDEGQFFYVTDELVGCDLETGLEDSGGLAPRKSYAIVRAVCLALDAAHKAGVVHGGLRPRNVFLMPLDVSQGSGNSRTAAVKVLDFGAARLGGGTDRGILAGLPAYLAPEQIDGHVGPKSDLFALGVLMYELFSGAMPVFRGAQALAGAQRGVVSPPANVDPPLARLIVSLLDSEPARRPASARAVLTELDRWAQSAHGLPNPMQPAVVRRRGPTAMSGSIGPDSTIRMSKFDAIALAQETLPAGIPTQEDEMVEGPKMNDSEDAGSEEKTTLSAYPQDPRSRASAQPGPTHATEGRKTMTQKPTSASPPGKSPKDANASESVEASLEDFISQANASFPAATDGWDLHTGDVELIDDEESGHPIAKPRTVPQGAPVAAAPVAVAPISRPYAAVEPQQQITEVVSMRGSTSTMPAVTPQASWTQNPLIVGAIVLGAVIVGAGVMFMAIRTMVPQPQQPTQIIVQQPAAVPAPAAAPVVTPLPPAAAPVAAPVAAPAAAAPVAAAPVVTPLPPAAAPASPEAALAAIAAKAAAPAPKKAPAAKKSAPKAEAAPKKETAPAAKKEAAAPAAKKEAPAKKESKKGSGSDWVDPFAN